MRFSLAFACHLLYCYVIVFMMLDLVLRWLACPFELCRQLHKLLPAELHSFFTCKSWVSAHTCECLY